MQTKETVIFRSYQVGLELCCQVSFPQNFMYSLDHLRNSIVKNHSQFKKKFSFAHILLLLTMSSEHA